MIEAPDELFTELAASVLDAHGFAIDLHHFAVLGRCAACREIAAAAVGATADD
jgi:Fe2+ or Zn2+ uptake regulation protein